MNFPKHALADVNVAVLDCEHKTPVAAATGHPYIAIPDVVGGRVELTTTRRISDSDLSEWTRRTTPQAGDVLVTRRGRVGDTAVIPDVPCAIGQNLVLLRSRGAEVRQDFLRWAARSPQWWSEVDRLRNVGAVFSSLNVRDIARIRIPVPDSESQRRIAAVLGALDDKIAANAKLASTVDTLADSIFARAVAGIEKGPHDFGSLASIQGGGTPSTKVNEYWNGDINWATPTDITNLDMPYLEATGRLITKDGLKACSSALHPAGSILMTSRATIGAFAIAQVPTAVNQGFIVVNAHEPDHQWWLFHEMRSRVPEFLAHANGATFLELSRGKFKKLQVRLAHEATVKEFSAAVAPLHERARAASVESAQLAKARDVLLPLLMSGKLRVDYAERILAGATVGVV